MNCSSINLQSLTAGSVDFWRRARSCGLLLDHRDKMCLSCIAPAGFELGQEWAGKACLNQQFQIRSFPCWSLLDGCCDIPNIISNPDRSLCKVFFVWNDSCLSVQGMTAGEIPLMGKILACSLLQCSPKKNPQNINKNITCSLSNGKTDDLLCKQGKLCFGLRKLDSEIQCPLIEDQSYVRKQIETFRLLSIFSTSCLLGFWERTQVSRFDISI